MLLLCLTDDAVCFGSRAVALLPFFSLPNILVQFDLGFNEPKKLFSYEKFNCAGSFRCFLAKCNLTFFLYCNRWFAPCCKLSLFSFIKVSLHCKL